MRFMTSLCVLAGLSLPLASARAETLEDVEKKIEQLFEKRKTVQIKMKSKSDYQMEGTSMKMQADISSTYAKRGDKWLSHSVSKIAATRKSAQEAEVQEDAKLTQVFDGDRFYTLNESADGKNAMKMKPQPGQINPFSIKQIWAEMKKHFDVKLLPDEKVDGKVAWVVESRPKKAKEEAKEGTSPTPNPMQDMIMTTYYRQSDGVAVKVTTKDKAGKTVQLMETTEVKFDADVDPELFKFKAPAGVQVVDMDAMQNQSGEPQGSSSADKAAEEEKTTAAGDQKADASSEESKDKEQPKEEPKPEKKKGVGSLLKGLKR